MLTRDLLSFRLQRGRVLPGFVDVADPELLGVAATLIGLFQPGGRPRRGALTEDLEQYLRGCLVAAIARGLAKLLEDRCEFSQPQTIDYPAWRIAVLTQAAALRRDGAGDNPAQLRALAVGTPDHGPLYADLPENDELVAFRAVTPKELLERYNVALVQGLLLTAGSLTIRTRESHPASLRRVCKFLKFFRLLARLLRESDGSLRLEVDGPLSILDSARKYGLQLAGFFPAVCLLPDWQLTATVEAKGRQVELALDQATGLVSHYRNLSAYVPEEVLLFARHFREKVTGWSLVPETPFLTGAGAELIFPDFTFRHTDGTLFYLELFHRWHRTQLLPRLRHCISHPELPLILGIDQSLCQGELKELLDTGMLPACRFFSFRDYPTVAKVRACLDAGHQPPDLFTASANPAAGSAAVPARP